MPYEDHEPTTGVTYVSRFVTAVTEMKMLKRRGLDLEGSLQVTLMGEPLEEEGCLMEARLGNWLRGFRMNSV